MQPFFSSGSRRHNEGSNPSFDGRSLHCTIHPVSSMAGLGDNWKILEKKAHCSFFLSWPWIGTWLDGLKQPPLLFTALLDDEIVAMGLIARKGNSPQYLLNQSGNEAEDSVYIEFNGLLCDVSYDNLEAACWQWLRKDSALSPLVRRPRFLLNRLGEASFRQVAASKAPLTITAEDTAPYADLAAIGAEDGDFLASLSRNSRHKLRRAIGLYEAQEGELMLARPENADEAQRYLGRLIDFHQATWRARGKPGAFAPAFFEDFHRRLIANYFDQGIIDVIEIRSAEDAVGYLYNFLHHGAALSYQSGFRYDDDNRLKPGLVCHALAAQDYLDRGLDRYSFLAGDSRYKRSLSSDAERLYSVRIKGESRLSRLLTGKGGRPNIR